MKPHKAWVAVVLIGVMFSASGCDWEDAASFVNRTVILPDGSLYIAGGLEWFEDDDESWWEEHDQDVEWLIWPVNEFF